MQALFTHSRKPAWPIWLGVIIALVLLTTQTFAASGVKVSATVPAGEFKPGDSTTLTLQIDIPDGLHAQSHTPNEKFYIPLTAKVNAVDGLSFGEAIYPLGKDENYPALGKVNVYTGPTMVTVPVTVAKSAVNGQNNNLMMTVMRMITQP